MQHILQAKTYFTYTSESFRNMPSLEMRKAFEAYISQKYMCNESKRSTSGVIASEFGALIKNYLKNGEYSGEELEVKNCKRYLRSKNFRLFTFDELGVSDVPRIISLQSRR